VEEIIRSRESDMPRRGSGMSRKRSNIWRCPIKGKQHPHVKEAIEHAEESIKHAEEAIVPAEQTANKPMKIK
jgi:hypothetical protein